MSTREYVVTLHTFEDLDSFYEDMETPGGALYIPDRAVEVVDRRPVSRNTHYYLTDEEAELIRKDPRVLAVELNFIEAGFQLTPSWVQTSTVWNKSQIVSADHKNWGILRCVEGVQRSGWGSDVTPNVTGVVNVTASGKYVDVVIVDGHFTPAHPEFAVNSDGSGGSRVIQYNWFELSPSVTGQSSSTYVYTPYVDPSYPDTNGDGYSDRTVDNDHGAHVAGTAVGNTLGWARDANIYNISPYLSNPNFSSPRLTGLNHLDYLKVWHQSKPINPVTGIKNPTISNHSYGLTYSTSITNITTVSYRGVVYSGPFNHSQLKNFGIFNTASVAVVSGRNSSVEADFIDLISAGIIPIAAAGNDFSRAEPFSLTTTSDYYNYLQIPGGPRVHYNRGTIGAAAGVICVGSVDAVANEMKSNFSNCGPRIDVYAPGNNIMSVVNSTISTYSNDSRNTSYYLSKKSGTSMASPQVAGVVACLAETWPTAKASQIVSYLHQTSKTNQLFDGTGGPSDYTDLQGSENRYLYFVKQRPDSGQVGPKLNLGTRPSTGMVYPRPKIFRYGR